MHSTNNEPESKNETKKETESTNNIIQKEQTKTTLRSISSFKAVNPVSFDSKNKSNDDLKNHENNATEEKDKAKPKTPENSMIKEGRKPISPIFNKILDDKEEIALKTKNLREKSKEKSLIPQKQDELKNLTQPKEKSKDSFKQFKSETKPVVAEKSKNTQKEKSEINKPKLVNSFKEVKVSVAPIPPKSAKEKETKKAETEIDGNKNNEKTNESSDPSNGIFKGFKSVFLNALKKKSTDEKNENSKNSIADVTESTVVDDDDDDIASTVETVIETMLVFEKKEKKKDLDEMSVTSSGENKKTSKDGGLNLMMDALGGIRARVFAVSKNFKFKIKN